MERAAAAERDSGRVEGGVAGGSLGKEKGCLVRRRRKEAEGVEGEGARGEDEGEERRSSRDSPWRRKRGESGESGGIARVGHRFCWALGGWPSERKMARGLLELRETLDQMGRRRPKWHVWALSAPPISFFLQKQRNKRKEKREEKVRGIIWACG